VQRDDADPGEDPEVHRLQDPRDRPSRQRPGGQGDADVDRPAPQFPHQRRQEQSAESGADDAGEGRLRQQQAPSAAQGIFTEARAGLSAAAGTSARGLPAGPRHDEPDSVPHAGRTVSRPPAPPEAGI